MPITYNEAKAAGTLDKYTWQASCDPTTGLVAIPMLHAAPCVPKFTGTNSGASAPGVSSSSINIVFYVAKPDPQFDILAKRVGAYDSPEQILQGVKDYIEDLREDSTRPTGARSTSCSCTAPERRPTPPRRADAIKAAVEMHAFAVVNGPTQTKAFADELTSRGVMCVGNVPDRAAPVVLRGAPGPVRCRARFPSSPPTRRSS